MVFGDGILSNKRLADLGINDTCKLVLAWHHLDEDWRKHFDTVLYAALSDTLKALKSIPTMDAYSTNHAYLLSLLSGKHQSAKVYILQSVYVYEPSCPMHPHT